MSAEEGLLSSASVEDEEKDSKQNFTPIHDDTKRLPQPICIATLCPTMDLAAIGLMHPTNTNNNNSTSDDMEEKDNDENNNKLNSNTASSNDTNPNVVQIFSSNTIIVYRSIKWEKMFIINQTDISSTLNDKFSLDDHVATQKKNDTDNNNDNDDDASSSSSFFASYITWSPDGKTLVLGLNNGSILLYDIEASASPGVTPNPAVYLPSPPSTSCSMTSTTMTENNNKTANHTKMTNSSYDKPTTTISNHSPAITRSMTAARRKKVNESIPVQTTPMIPPTSSSSNTPTIPIHHKNSIVSLHWQRIKPCYKDWNISANENNQRLSWYFQSHYLDKATHFLPPCVYNTTYPDNHYNDVIDDGGGLFGGIGQGIGSASSGVGVSRQSSENLSHHHNDFEGSIDRHRPKCQTPLSILFSVTCSNGMHLYLQGRYRILSCQCPVSLCNKSTSITASSDLSNFLVSMKSSMKSDCASSLILYTLPDIATKRYQLQIISSSYCSIMSHLTALHEGMRETHSAWSGSLRQLDMKFDQLSTLLLKYGVMPSHCDTSLKKMTIVRRELMHYILGGHSTRSSNTSNAMDQFFTHPLMNDQLLQRLVKSLEANVIRVEGTIRKKILGPVRALLYDVGELHGQVKAMGAESDNHSYSLQEESDDANGRLHLMDEQTSLRLYEASEVLYFIAEQCVSQLVEIRFRLSCMMKWIRGTASQVKARGTAIDSVQRENAKKRRVPEQILKKVADFLSPSLHTDEYEINSIKSGSSEFVLGILFSDYFCKNKVSIQPPPTPLQAKNDNGDIRPPVETPSLKAALEISTQIALDLFEEPRTTLKQSLNQNQVILEEHSTTSLSDNTIVTVHNRIGASSHSSTHAESCFNPNIYPTNGTDSNCHYSKHWFIIANSCVSKVEGCNLLQITALPGAQFVPDVYDLHVDLAESTTPFYLTSFIALPNDTQITNIKFYGNDGNSVLTSETSPNDEEGKQALGLILRNLSGEEELWLFHYDDLEFRLIHQQNEGDNITIGKFDANLDQFCSISKSYSSEIEDNQKTNDRVVFSKCKFICYFNNCTRNAFNIGNLHSQYPFPFSFHTHIFREANPRQG